MGCKDGMWVELGQDLLSCGIFSCASAVSLSRELVTAKMDRTGIGCDAGRYMKLAEDRCKCEPCY